MWWIRKPHIGLPALLRQEIKLRQLTINLLLADDKIKMEPLLSILIAADRFQIEV